ncbi:hypothetical protein EV294_102357 [Paenibacillus sp. BK033]|uniref:hypothetical protein n=1 Tax=Paenibacillus sp. BK033 TaxID=2512133 RepID=UPI001051D42F|nr:hypothetical protein [Paenibacillus sp. BK033]NIK68642.1 4-amino-4-deoxy-L-arabinose transferase-like glycosyltransferase [Paenibacillus sp. BK720]TCM99070.1 hypothetical protein EV294_102357 [Paenibacillus sp. BK033]
MRPNKQNIYWFLAGVCSSAIVFIVIGRIHLSHIAAVLLTSVIVTLGGGSIRRAFRVTEEGSFHPLFFSAGMLLLFIGFSIIGVIV